MKRLKVVELIFLSTFLVFSSVPAVSKANANLLTAYPIPEEVCSVKPIPTIPENFTESYLNTTNPHSNIVSPMSAFDEIDDMEAHHPIYVLVAGDEEERQTWRWLGESPVGWKSWEILQIERGDEALVANFGIDIRILGFLEWDSDDSLTSMSSLWYDLESKTSQYLGQVHCGNRWYNYVDAIIGITAQATPDEPNIPGIAPGPAYLDQGRIFAVLKWQVYWMDDNIVQHEFSHLFYADDHWDDCCVMAGHTHSQTWIYEDGLWWVFNDIPCAYTAYSWCDECLTVIDQHKSKYQSDLPILLYWYCPYFNKPMTIYYWYYEDSGKILREVDWGPTQATTR